MNCSDLIFQEDDPPVNDIPRRVKSDWDGRTSAQSPLAHWDEDWTLIVDMTERRRIQNRIAQRNYRRRLKERLSRLSRIEEHASRSEKSSKKEKHLKDRKDDPPLCDSSRSQTSHKGILPFRIATPKPATEEADSSTHLHQEHDFGINQQPFSSADSLSPSLSSLDSQVSLSMMEYPDFATMFGYCVFDYPGEQVWRRATWPHQ